jgi:hypothetical protein
MELEITVSSRVSRAQKGKCGLFPSYSEPRPKQSGSNVARAERGSVCWGRQWRRRLGDSDGNILHMYENSIVKPTENW